MNWAKIQRIPFSTFVFCFLIIIGQQKTFCDSGSEELKQCDKEIGCIEGESQIKESTGQIEDADSEGTLHEKDKYFEQNTDILRESQDALGNFLREGVLIAEEPDQELKGSSEEIVQEEVRNVFEFPKLKIVDPGRVNDEVDLELEDGRIVKRITRARRPPVFTIPNFLTPEECDLIVKSARAKGLGISKLFGAELENAEAQELNGSDISRISEQTWLFKQDVNETFYQSLQKRLALLTQLPIEIIRLGEPMQVVAYQPGGHYHAHIDTAPNMDTPCCFQTRCGDKEYTDKWDECCRLCRFITVLYYLNDVEAGGETAFPLADLPEEVVEEKFAKLSEKKWHNLSLYCHDSSLVVKPERGMAVMWYNSFINEKTSYLGQPDRMSHHGGCDIIKGNKWIANNWIAGTTFEDRFKESIFYLHN